MPTDGENRRQPAQIVYPDIAPEDKPLYANAILVNHTPWDFALHFDRVLLPIRTTEEHTERLQIPASKVAIINIPVTLVRGFIEALQTNLNSYEEQYGKVTIPKKGDPE